MWQLILNGVDITAKVSQVTVTFAAENVCGEITVELADRDVLDGIIVPRVQREPLISYQHSPDHPVVWFYLEDIQQPQDLNAKTASVWGRSASARLTSPWAQKISKQWPGGNTVAGIIAEVAALCGVTVNVTNDFDVCQYCYAVSDQTPAEIIRDLATRSGQIIWPQVDGTILIAPRLYTYGTPDVVLSSDDIIVESVDRQVPDFGNRILVSGDASIAGLSVQVVPLVDDTECVAADGVSSVRLIAIVLGADGLPVAEGTVVTWSASAGIMSAATSLTQDVIRQGEVQQAQSYYTVTLDLPALTVVGVYARRDVRRARNLYVERGGSVSGRVITFAHPLDFYDQTVFVDYLVMGAPNTWIAGRIPGDVSVLASVAGAQGFCTLHQSNPTACATQISLESSPSSPCLGDAVSILLKTTMFGGAGVGAATFGIQGCGSLTSTRKLLTPRTVTETLRTSVWGGAAEVRLSAIPVSGTGISVVLTETPGANLYASHQGQVVILSNAAVLPGTQVTVTYTAGGTALVGWTPTALPAGYETVQETVHVTHADVGGTTKAQVTLTRTPTPTTSISAVPTNKITSYYESHDGKVVTLEDDAFLAGPLPIGQAVRCTYQSVWLTQPGCNAIITVRVDDGSEDGGRAQIAVSARDCRTVNPDTYDPDDPTQIPDDVPAGGETDEHDPTEWLEPEEPEISPIACNSASINALTPTITADNHSEVFVSGGCPGNCTCDQICASLRSTGRLSTEAGMTYSTCMAACAKARNDKCTPCTLTGPATLNPGEEGVWDDGKGNSAELSGGNALTFVSRDFETGYRLRMPTGGEGPFTIRVCYGETEDSCCEAEVDFPPCSLSGLTTLAPGAESLYMPSAGMTGASCTCSGDMSLVRASSVGFVCRMSDTGCAGTVAVFYSGRVCGVVEVENPLQNYTGVVSGPSTLEPAEVGVYYHDLGPTATYTGDLPVISVLSGVGGNGVTCMMPANAPNGQEFTVSFTGPCNSSATNTVSTYPGCNATIPTSGTGSPVGMFVRCGTVAGYVCGIVSSEIDGTFTYISCNPATHEEAWGTSGDANIPNGYFLAQHLQCLYVDDYYLYRYKTTYYKVYII